MSNVNNTKEIFTIPEIARMTGLSDARVRTLIKSGTINGNLNVNAVNDNKRKVKRMEVTKDDLVKFAIINPELAGPLMNEEFVREELVALTNDTVEEPKVDVEDVTKETSVDEDIAEETVESNDPSAEQLETENGNTLGKPDELDVDNAGGIFEGAASADTENHCDLIESVIEDHINILTKNCAAFDKRKREIEEVIADIDSKLERATKVLNQIRERKCAVNDEE